MSALAVLPAPTQGQNSTDAPNALAAKHGRLVRNLLCDRAGKVVMRGDLRLPWTQTFTAGTALSYRGGWVKGQTVLQGQSATYRVHDMLAQTSSASFTPTSSAAAGTHGPHAEFADFTYGWSLVNASFWRWDGGSLVGSAVAYANAPTGVAGSGRSALTRHLNRVFVCGGTTPGVGAPYIPNALYWSDDDGPTTDTLAKWQDDATGLTNKIVFGTPDFVPVALLSYRNSLLIIGDRATYVLTGTSPAAWLANGIRKLTDYGCLAYNAATVTADCAYWWDRRGLVRYDGAEVRVVSRPIGDIARRITSRFETSGQDGEFSLIALDSEYLLFVGAAELWCGLYYLPTDSWSELTSAVLTNSNLQYALRASGKAYGWDSVGRTFDLRGVVGVSNSGVLPSVDEQNPAGGGAVIPADLRTRVARLGTPSRKAMLERIMVEYIVDTSGGAWELSAEDAEGNVLVAAANLPAATTARQQAVVDVYREVEEVVVRMRYVGTGTAFAECSVGDITLDYQPAQNRTG